MLTESNRDSWDQEELLEMILEKLEPSISDFFQRKGLVLSNIEVDGESGDSFTIYYESNDYKGRIPTNISYILSDLQKVFEKELGVTCFWSFAPNGNCNQITFYLDSPLDPKFLKIKEILDTY